MMQIYRSGIKICTLLCVLSLIVMLCEVFNIPSRINFLNNLIKHAPQLGAVSYDIALGIFASALVVLIINIVSYLIEKKKTMNLIRFYCKEYIEEMVELVPKLSKSDKKIDNVDEIKMIVRGDESVFQILKNLDSINNERLLKIDGFHPLCKKNEKNLEYHQLMCSLAKFNQAVQDCRIAYKVKNNPLYGEEINVDELKFTVQLETLLQLNGNTEYEQFIDLLEKTLKDDPFTTVNNTSREECL